MLPGVADPLLQTLRRTRICAIALTVALCTPVGTAPQDGQDVRDLAPGEAVLRELSAGQAHAYLFTASRGNFVHLTIRQQGIDVAAVLTSPDGRTLVTVDAMDDEFRPETIAAIAEVDGTYTVVARAVQPRSRGRYSVTLDPPRAATESDSLRVDAERAFARARGQRDVNRASTWPEALADFNRARDRFHAAGDRHGELKALIEIGVTENYMSRSEARVAAEEAERLARALDDRPALARALRVLASIHALAGAYDLAARAVEEATTINRAIGNRTAELQSVNYTANMVGRLGDVERAIALYEHAIDLARATGNRGSEATILTNLARAYDLAGERQKALTLYDQAFAIAMTTNNPRARIAGLSGLAAARFRLNDYRGARELRLQALELARTNSSALDESNQLIGIGLTYSATRDHANALEYFRQGLDAARRNGDRRDAAFALNESGSALRRLGRYDEALAAARESLTIYEDLRARAGQREALTNLSRIEYARGRLDEGVRHLWRAIEIDEALRGEMTSPELRTSFVAAEQDRYALLIDMLQRKHASEAASGHDTAALAVSERARARELLDSLLDARVDLRQGVDPALLARERSLQKELSDASAALARNVSAAAAQNLERLAAEYRLAQARIREDSPRYADVMQPRPLTAAEIQSSVIDEDTVLLEFALGFDRSWLWAVTQGTVASVELPSVDEIEPAARALYQLFTARQKRRDETSSAYMRRVAAADARLGTQAAELSRLLLGGIAAQLHGEWRAKRLAIVAGGALEYLPFAALPVPAVAGAKTHGAPRLAASHEIVMLPSASVLAVLRREIAGRARAPRALAILADPVFARDDPRVPSQPRQPASTSVADESTSRYVDVMDSLYARGGMARLPFSREEADAIAALTGPRGALKAVDFAASRSTVVGGGLSGYRIVHMATHGMVDSERPALSSLVLSLVDERGARQNGYLRLHDIYNLRLDAELVVLSACQTALGKEIKGEGLVGLTRAFLYAGAPRVVASLWQVNDHATSELMTHFYRGMLQEGLRPAAALRAAQRRIAQDPRWASPYFWAGFVLQGEWR
jgi:CHAT domain-containing protein